MLTTYIIKVGAGRISTSHLHISPVVWAYLPTVANFVSPPPTDLTSHLFFGPSSHLLLPGTPSNHNDPPYVSTLHCSLNFLFSEHVSVSELNWQEVNNSNSFWNWPPPCWRVPRWYIIMYCMCARIRTVLLVQVMSIFPTLWYVGAHDMGVSRYDHSTVTAGARLFLLGGYDETHTLQVPAISFQLSLDRCVCPYVDFGRILQSN